MFWSVLCCSFLTYVLKRFFQKKIVLKRTDENVDGKRKPKDKNYSVVRSWEKRKYVR